MNIHDIDDGATGSYKVSAAAWDGNRGALRLEPIRSPGASSISPMAVGKKLDALFTNPSSRPNRATTDETMPGSTAMSRRSPRKHNSRSGRWALKPAAGLPASAAERR